MMPYRFADFEVRKQTGEILKSGYRIRLQPQPFRILCMLLERPGELVSRQELAHELWGNDTWTDAERGINMAINKLRDVLDDSAKEPRLIETLPRRGYRFIGVLEARQCATPVSLGPDDQTPRVPQSPPAPPWSRFRGGKTFIPLLAVAVLLISAAVGLYRFVDARQLDPASRQQLSVLVGLFTNETGERELDGVVENALHAEFTASPALSVASGERVRDALRLMRQPDVDRIPLALAQEVGRRDPGIQAIIAGSIQKIGTGYLLTARIFRNGSGEAPSVLQETADNRDRILAAVARLSAAVHRSLGRNPPSSRGGGRPPERVTTSSMEALRIYSDANELAGDGNFKAAELLLRKALEMDPRFASAYMLLAHEIRNQADRTPEEYMPFAERAQALSGEASEEEAYFIRASYQFLRGDYRQAIAVYEAMLQRFPEHGWANNNLYRLYMAEGLSDRMRLLIDRQLKIRPNDPAGYYRAGFACLCSDDSSPDRMLDYARHGMLLARQRGEEIGWADADSHLRAMAAWMKGDLPETRRQLESGADAVTRTAGYMTLGMFRQAKGSLGAMEDARFRNSWALWVAILSGDRAEAARLSLLLAPNPATEADMIALLRAGRIKPTAGLLGRLQAPRYGQAVRQVAFGELTFRQGRTKEAIETLKPAVESMSYSNFEARLLGAMTLADALLTEGRTNEAVASLESATARRGCGGFYSARFWPFVRRQLMDVYRNAGREVEAAQIHAELARLAGLADDETFPAAGALARR